MRMKKIKMTALVLCASMLVGIAGCQATDKPLKKYKTRILSI